MGSCKGSYWFRGKVPTIIDESVYDNHQNMVDERFSWLEAQVVDINNNVSLLMKALNNNIRLFGEYGCLT